MNMQKLTNRHFMDVFTYKLTNFRRDFQDE